MFSASAECRPSFLGCPGCPGPGPRASGQTLSNTFSYPPMRSFGELLLAAPPPLASEAPGPGGRGCGDPQGRRGGLVAGAPQGRIRCPSHDILSEHPIPAEDELDAIAVGQK